MLCTLGSAGLQPPSRELADITPGKGGSRWDIAMALPTAKLNIKHLAEGSGVLTAQEVCHGGTAKKTQFSECFLLLPPALVSFGMR